MNSNRRRTASIALYIILIAASIGIVAFVLSNGSAPVGPAIPSGGGTPLPTSTPAPTATPQPAPTLVPTATPQPTPTPGAGGSSLGVNLPITSGGSSSTSNYEGIPGVSFQGSGGAFVVADDIYFFPFTTVASITVNRVSFEVTSAGNPGDGCRVGIYDDAGNFQPGSLVADWGQIINDSTGYKHATVSTALTAGKYLIAFLCNSGPAFTGYNAKTYQSSGVDVSTTSSTRFVNLMRVSSPTAGQYAGGFASTGDQWDTVDLSNVFNFGSFVILRWS